MYYNLFSFMYCIVTEDEMTLHQCRKERLFESVDRLQAGIQEANVRERSDQCVCVVELHMSHNHVCSWAGCTEIPANKLLFFPFLRRIGEFSLHSGKSKSTFIQWTSPMSFVIGNAGLSSTVALFWYCCIILVLLHYSGVIAYACSKSFWLKYAKIRIKLIWRTCINGKRKGDLN